MAKKPKPNPCPCGGADYAACCGRYHSGEAALDAETLMRSRYSAYALKLENYLLETWHETTRPERLDLATDQTKWIRLEVKQHSQPAPDQAFVEFVAHCKIGGRATKLHETSRFVREAGRWFYLDGENE